MKIGLWGGSGGTAQDIIEVPKRLVTVTINCGDAIDSIEFTYTDRAGQERSAGPWGGSGGVGHQIGLASHELVHEVSGTYDFVGGVQVINSFKLVTNLRTWGPMGVASGTTFCTTAPTDTSIVGFYARSGTFLDAIGVYCL
ncbi:hypothetical protein EJB05_27990, partial [Eragrostis curvula]